MTGVSAELQEGGWLADESWGGRVSEDRGKREGTRNPLSSLCGEDRNL